MRDDYDPEEEDHDLLQQEMMEYNEKNLVRLFDVLLCVDCAEINKLNVHKGKEPSVEIKCYDNTHRISLLFTGDMERQRFIDVVFDVMQKMENSNSESSENEDEPTIAASRIKSSSKRKQGETAHDDSSEIDDGSQSEEATVD